MTWLRALPLLILTVLVVALLAYTPSGAADDNRVAVVIDYGNDQVVTRCVSFSEDNITGYEALERTGLAVETDFQTGGAAVCRIDDQGCPPDDCFCSCRGGGDCIYWSYWHFTNGTWNYSSAGSGLYQVTDGAVEGWVWGLGSVTQAQPPPVVSFADVCATAATNTPTTTATATNTATRIFLPTALPTSAAPVATATIPLLTATAAATATMAPILSTSAILSGTTPAAPPATAVRITATLPPEAPTLPATPAPAFEVVGSQASSSGVSAVATQPQPTVADNQTGLPAVATPPLELPVEPTGGLLDGGAGVAAATGLATTATPLAVAIIGAEADEPAAANSLPAAPAEAAATWPAYAGFVGLLLLLSALALLVYRRRVGEVRR